MSGASAVLIARWEDGFLDGLVDVERRHAVGINGCTLTKLAVDEERRTIGFEVRTSFVWSQELSIEIISSSCQDDWEVLPAGQSVGRFNCSALKQGVQIPQAALQLQQALRMLL